MKVRYCAFKGIAVPREWLGSALCFGPDSIDKEIYVSVAKVKTRVRVYNYSEEAQLVPNLKKWVLHSAALLAILAIIGLIIRFL